jgi:hypothetical protein
LFGHVGELVKAELVTEVEVVDSLDFEVIVVEDSQSELVLFNRVGLSVFTLPGREDLTDAWVSIERHVVRGLDIVVGRDGQQD